MPHVVVKLWPGKSPGQKQALSNAIVEAVRRELGYGEESVAVGFVEVKANDWMREVYQPDMQRGWESLTKVPGYGPGRSSG